MEEHTQKTDLPENISRYVRVQFELLRLKLIRQAAVTGSGVTASLIILTIIGLGFVILSFGLALYISEKLGSNYKGFLLTGGIYFIVALLLFIFRKPIIMNPVRNTLISGMLDDVEKTKV